MKTPANTKRNRWIVAAISVGLILLFVLPNLNLLGTKLEWTILFFGSDLSIGAAFLILLVPACVAMAMLMLAIASKADRLEKAQQATKKELEEARKAAVVAVNAASEAQKELGSKEEFGQASSKTQPTPRGETPAPAATPSMAETFAR